MMLFFPGMTSFIREVIEMEQAELRLRAVCTPDMIERVTDLVTQRTYAIMRDDHRAGRPWAVDITQAINSVYRDVAEGLVR